jgi:hypothetical protein
LIRRFRTADGLNTMMRRGEIGTSLPVFGLRPIRRPFLRFLVMTLFRSGFTNGFFPVSQTLARTARMMSFGLRYWLTWAR